MFLLKQTDLARGIAILMILIQTVRMRMDSLRDFVTADATALKSQDPRATVAAMKKLYLSKALEMDLALLDHAQLLKTGQL